MLGRGGGREWAEGAAAHPNFRRGAPCASAEGHANAELPCNR